MINISSDCPILKVTLENLVILLTSNGARLNPAIEIVGINKELSIRSTIDHNNHEEIIYIPSACIPSIADFSLSLENDCLAAAPIAGKNTSKLHMDIFNLMIDIYNLTGKIKTHRKTFPNISLINATNIFGHLVNGSQYEILNDRNVINDDYIIKSFISTRQFFYTENHKARMVILPVIDYLNHHSKGIGYIRHKSKMLGNGGISTTNSKPIISSNECYTSYNNDNDALGLYMKYGYVDIYTPIARSIPFSLDFGETGKIIINRKVLPKISIGSDAQTQSLNYPKDLHYYFPEFRKTDDSTLEVSSLIIPSGAAPLSLRRILSILIRMLASSIDNEDLLRLMVQAESTILLKNIDYYDELESLINTESDVNISSESKEAIQLLIKSQKHHFSEYKKRLSN